MLIYYYIGGAVIAAVLLILFFIFLIKKKKSSAGKKNDYYSRSRKSSEGLGKKLRTLFGQKVLQEKELEELEELLIKADIGPKLSLELIEKIRKKNIKDINGAIELIKNEVSPLFLDNQMKVQKGQLNILLVLGVNGVGKTTSIAKLAHYYLNQDYKVLLAAGDTFRAAAIEQLSNWAGRLDIPVIKQKQHADPAGVVFDAIDAAIAKKVDLLIIDTAGRMHNKQNLIDELKKIERIIQKKNIEHKQNLLVIDATTGQNAYQQAVSFHEAIRVNGLIITKYDSQSKGGIVINIEKNLEIPFFFIGTGEKIDDFKAFNKEEFINNIFA